MKSAVLIIRAVLASTFFAASAHAATYYIDYNAGSDANAGTSASAPWKRHPFMKDWGGGGKYGHASGDRFVFKGGVVWPAASFPLQVSTGGASGASDVYDVDKTWFTGSVYTRPVFDGQGTATNGIFSVDASNVTINGIEMRDVVFTSNEGSGLVSIGNTPKNVVISNSYLHKWTLSGGISSDDAHGGVIVNTANVPPVGIVVNASTISNSEYSTSHNNGVAIRNVQTVSNSTISDVPTAILYAGDVHSNNIYNINYPKADFDPSYHTNLIYMAAQSFNPPINKIYDNYIHDVGTGAGIYAEPCFYTSFGSASIYIYNNIVYNSMMSGGGIILVDPESGSGACGNVYIYQNTLQMPDNSQIGMIRTIANHSGTNQIANLQIKDNLYIGPNDEWDTALAATSSSTNNVKLTNAQATAYGYTVARIFLPTASTAPGVGKGSVISCSACVSLDHDFVGTARGANWDVGAMEFGAVVVPPPLSLSVN